MEVNLAEKDLFQFLDKKTDEICRRIITPEKAFDYAKAAIFSPNKKKFPIDPEVFSELSNIKNIRQTATLDEKIFVKLCGESTNPTLFASAVNDTQTLRRLKDKYGEYPETGEISSPRENNVDCVVNYLISRRSGDIITKAEIGILLYKLGFYQENTMIITLIANQVEDNIREGGLIYNVNDDPYDGPRAEKSYYQAINNFLENKIEPYDSELAKQVFPNGIPSDVDDFSQIFMQYIASNHESYVGRGYDGIKIISNQYQQNKITL